MDTESLKEFFRPTKVKVVLLIFLAFYIFVNAWLEFMWSACVPIIVVKFPLSTLTSHIVKYIASPLNLAGNSGLIILISLLLSICYFFGCILVNLYKYFGEFRYNFLKYLFVIAIVLFLFTPISIQQCIPASPGPFLDGSLERARQKINIRDIFVNGTGLYFKVKASGMNTLPIDMRGTNFYINYIPKTAGSWPGFSTDCTSGNLAPAESCYGMIPDYNLSNCNVGDVFRVIISWGAESSKEINGCTDH